MIRYFISDLHLSDKRPDLIRAFVKLCGELIERNKEAELYILGDFYEAWIGDDYQPHWNTPVEGALLTLSQSGINVFILHGNRDFLLGKEWLNRVGAILIKEQTVLSLENNALLLTHGDEYCLEDTEYQAFRKTVRSTEWQMHILAMPLEQRIILAAQLRNDSQSMASGKSNDIMDVTTLAVEHSLAEHQCCAVIHGHTHRPNVHQETEHVRCVLGDWDEFIWLASVEGCTYTQCHASVENFLQHGLKGLHETHKVSLFS
ncbi:UDP-2,3-diacylglucosamine diphosphatase [Marinomonas sp. IMCC 4694]|uniref:UDP-2,3-diacylglucosamine diphosphatase n=1 Tax=Marinomonas sp. IMCC 4694 TaxID=2605432 RepID=UPI0011E72BCA|nr:UDP-2,3-diacylglucosamine diphosphatase [Marinomonas sp. IMCC 4694]TYL47717.1 UDP-2,3-diacylglucosamine diphosphatase [Marinomonas sp. IMCC 4694]